MNYSIDFFRTSGKEDANCNSLVDNVPSRTSKRKEYILSFEKSSGKSDKCASNKTSETLIERASRRKERINCTTEPTSVKEVTSQKKSTPEKGKNTMKRTTRSAGKKASEKSVPIHSKGPDTGRHQAEQSSCESQDAASDVVSVKREPEVKAEPAEAGESSSCDNTARAAILEGRSNKSKNSVELQPIVVRVKTEPMDFEESGRRQSGFSMDQLSSFFSETTLSSPNYRNVLRVRSGKRQLLLKIIEHTDQQTVLPETFAKYVLNHACLYLKSLIFYSLI